MLPQSQATAETRYHVRGATGNAPAEEAQSRMMMTQIEDQTPADREPGTEVLRVPEELDLATADGLAEQAYAAIASHARLLLLDLTGLSFCDARGLSAFVRIANHADAAGCRYGLIAPAPPVTRILRIGGLAGRMPVYSSIDDALGDLAPMVRPPRGETTA